MKRPSGWKPDPQAIASARAGRFYDGSELLGKHQDSDTWLTPRFILAHLGGFALDTCAAECNPGWTGCGRQFTAQEDGLHQPWVGRVFMNPPFSNTVPWLQKHAEHAHGISLVPASVESRIWREMVWPRAGAILLLHGRTRFANPDGSTTTGRPLRSIALIAWHSEDVAILRDSPLAGVFLEDWDQR